LAGHGESGANRRRWGLPEFGADVKAVVDAEKLRRVILFGNSLGGPTVIEAALLLPDRVIGVVGIDTFQSLDYSMTMEEARQRAEVFRADYSGSVKSMVKMLFYSDVDPALLAEAEKRMQKTPPDAAHAMFMFLAGYSPAASSNESHAFWPRSDKPRGLGRSPKATPGSGGTYVNMREPHVYPREERPHCWGLIHTLTFPPSRYRRTLVDLHVVRRGWRVVECGATADG
jgi:pimeloyl-ACP methyl ester carboxylesterase